jgi:hypothetical protein
MLVDQRKLLSPYTRKGMMVWILILVMLKSLPHPCLFNTSPLFHIEYTRWFNLSNFDDTNNCGSMRFPMTKVDDFGQSISHVLESFLVFSESPQMLELPAGLHFKIPL